MPIAKTSAKSASKVIIFDQKVEAKKRAQHMKVFGVSKFLRESGNKNIYRCVQAILDPISVKLFGLKPERDANKAVTEVCFPNKNVEELTDAYCTMIINETKNSMTAHGYKILRTAIYRDPEDEDHIVGKILVDIPEVKEEPINAKKK